MKINGEKIIGGEVITTPEKFIEDVYDRVNSVIEKVEEFEKDAIELGFLHGFIDGLAGRLNRVCEN